MNTQKFSLLVLFTIFSFTNLWSQTRELEIFSGGGEKFILYFNGIQQTGEPVTNVRVSDIQQDFVSVRIVFDDKTKGELSKNFPLNAGTLTTAQIKLNNKGSYKLAYMGEVAIASAPAPAPTQVKRAYSSTPVETTTTTTSTTINSNDNPNMNINMNVAGTAMSVNMTGMEGTTTYTETTTTTTTSSSGFDNMEEAPVDEGCVAPMKATDFAEDKKSIELKSFEDSKLAIAKQVTDVNCLSTNQVKEIIRLFSFEETKLEYAKYAYPYTFDQNNYYKVNDEFTFEATIEELNESIKR